MYTKSSVYKMYGVLFKQKTEINFDLFSGHYSLLYRAKIFPWDFRKKMSHLLRYVKQLAKNKKLMNP